MRKQTLLLKASRPTVKENFSDDWADLRHYEAENKRLPAPNR
jgi:hypothetical protein